MKKTLKLAGIFCLFAAIFNIVLLALDIFYYEFSVYDTVADAICLALSVATGTVYLVFMGKNKEYVLKHRSIFLVLAILNIFNNLVVWVIAFWVQMSVNRELQPNVFMHRSEGEVKWDNEKSSTGDEKNIQISEEDYSEKRIAQDLTEKLNELNKLREKKLISEDEYKKMRQECIEKFMK